MPANFNSTPTSTTSLGANQFPVSAVFVPGTSSGNTTALQGGPASTDANGYTTAPMVTTGAFVEQASLSAGVLNADLVASVDVSAYKWLSLQVEGTYSGTLSFQASNDNVNFESIQLLLSTSPNVNNLASSTSGSGQIWTGPVFFRYLRVRMTAYTSGTATGTLELYAVPPVSWGVASNGAIQSGTWTVQPGNTPNTTPWLSQQNVAGAPSYVFHSVKNVSITAGTPVAVWTPASGKRFRLLGCCLYPTGLTTSAIFLEDSTGATNEFMRFPRLNSTNTGPTPINFAPNGYLSTAANNALFLDVSVNTAVEGYVYGSEE